jgi:hypothetical protein
MKHETELVSKKQPRHIAIGTRHLVIQRDKLIIIRDNAIYELKGIDAALLALGWQEQLNLL